MARASSRVGLLLINLGTPASPEPADVDSYLREFLMDPLVIDIPWPLRWLLVNAILPKRKHASAALYRKIWTSEGSPLMRHTRVLAEKVQVELGDEFVVRPAMRYAQPSIGAAMTELRAGGIDSLIAFPLYPQYSLAATESSKVELEKQVARLMPGIPTRVIGPFYDDPRYLDAVAAISRPYLAPGDHAVFSFHGLPERQVKKTAAAGHCDFSRCCERISAANANCYRAQSFHTAREVAARLGLAASNWQIGFQSRLGRTPWIQPYTDVLYETLPAQGIKRLAVLSPSFVADCLETLEEVQIRGLESFRRAGGESLTLVPSLNDHPIWVKTVAAIAKGLPAEKASEAVTHFTSHTS